MARETLAVWRCEYENCKHAWIAQNEEPPRRCAKCRKCNWHKTATLKEAIRHSNWLDQLIDAARPVITEEIRVQIVKEILDVKRRKTEYVTEVVKPEVIAEHVSPVSEIPICGHKWWEDAEQYECLMDKGHKSFKHGQHGMARKITD